MPVRGKGYLGFQPFFPREIDSFALELWFIVDFVCQIVFRKIGNKFPFDVTAKRIVVTPPPPPTALPPVPVSLTGPYGILNPSLACVTLIHRNGDLTNSSTANLVPRVFGLFGQRDNAAQKARIRSEDDPKTLQGQKHILWIRDTRLRAGCEQWGTTSILMDLASLFLWSFGKKSC